jgi:hypothetical protein
MLLYIPNFVSLLCKSEIEVWQGNASDSLLLIITAIKLALRLQESSAELAKGLALLSCGVITVLNNLPLADRCSAAALKVAEPLYNPAIYAKLQELITIKDAGQCSWDSVVSRATEASELFKSLRDSRGWETSTTTLADSSLFQGDYDRSAFLYGSVLVSASQRDDFQVQIWAWLGLCYIYWINGNIKYFFVAVDEMEALLTLHSEQVDFSSRLSAQLMICFSRLLRGQLMFDVLNDCINTLIEQEYCEYRMFFGLEIASVVSIIYIYMI